MKLRRKERTMKYKKLKLKTVFFHLYIKKALTSNDQKYDISIKTFRILNCIYWFDSFTK